VQNVNVPEDLSVLSDEDLTALGLSIREAAEALAEEATGSDEALADIERLASEFDRVNDELSSREAKQADRAERAAAALSKFDSLQTEETEAEGETADADDADSDEAEADEATDEATDEVAPAPELVSAGTDAESELIVEDAEEAADEPAPVAEEAVEASITPEATEAPAEALAEVEFTEEDSHEDSATTPSEFSEAPEVLVTEDSTPESTARVPSVDELSTNRPDGLAPVADASAIPAVLVASNAVPGIAEGTSLDHKRLAAAIAKKRYGMNNTSAGTFERIVLATAEAKLPNKVGGGAEENFDILRRVQSQWASERASNTSLVASGGCCAPLEPSYDFFRLAEPQNPVEQALPTVEAPRGGIRFISPPDFRDAFGGVRITTCEEDEAGYPPTEPKPCVRVDCPPVEECRVDAVSQCVEFGNLQYRTFPEQVEAFLEDLAVAFTATKEVAYLDAIDGASTAVTTSPAYGASRSVAQVILAAATAYRRRHSMNRTAVLSLMLPSWVMELVKVDLINDHSLGLSLWNVDEATVMAFFASNNLDVAWYYHSATGAGQGFDDVQNAGALNEFPTSIVGYMFAPGTFVRLDGGTLDVGIVRDSRLNGTNDLQIFSEQWVQVCQIGLESIRLEIPVCPDGTAPEPVLPLVCG